ncbi:MAG: hypothetical protein FJX74_06790 [Armatimonadetes bacterium]|nr:hypothetical protein [Armatimonadota bacterium]
MRTLRGHHLLTALPFILLYAADEVALTTRVEDDGTGVRSVKIVSRPDTKPYVKAFADEEKIGDLLPATALRRLESGEVADSHRIVGDFRFVQGSRLGDLKITRQVRLGTWPILRTAYAYEDKVSRTEFSETERELAAAPKTEFTYSVTMPGPIDQASVLPPGGVVDGHTVTWTLAADKASHDIAVSASRPDWAPQALCLIVLLLVALSIVRFVRYRERTTPRRI